MEYPIGPDDHQPYSISPEEVQTQYQQLALDSFLWPALIEQIQELQGALILDPEVDPEFYLRTTIYPLITRGVTIYAPEPPSFDLYHHLSQLLQSFLPPDTVDKQL